MHGAPVLEEEQQQGVGGGLEWEHDEGAAGDIVVPHRDARHAELLAGEQLVLVPGGGDGEQGLAEDVGRRQAVKVHEDPVRVLARVRLGVRVRVSVLRDGQGGRDALGLTP